MIKWESIAEYSERTGMKPSSIKNLIKIGELKATKTDGGGKIMILVEEKSNDPKDKLESFERKLDAICKHLGVNIQEKEG